MFKNDLVFQNIRPIFSKIETKTIKFEMFCQKAKVLKYTKFKSFPRQEFLKIEREYRRKSLDPDRPIDKSVIDRVRDLFSETVTPQGETVQTAQVQEIKTPPLPGTPMPNVKTAQANVNPVTNLTATQEALLSPEEKIIAGRT